MTKKWLMYVVTGLLCCGALAFAVAKQAPRARMTARDVTKLELTKVQEQMLKAGQSQDLVAKEANLKAELGLQNEKNAELSAAAPNGYTPATNVAVATPAPVTSEHEQWKQEVLRISERIAAGLSVTENEKDMLSVYNDMLNPPTEETREGDRLDAQGGPSAFGYMWVDNTTGDTATYAWEEPTAPIELTTISSTDDAGQAVPFGFNFPFFGVNYTTGYAGTNGYIDLSTLTADFSNDCPRSLGTPTGAAVFGYWDDGNTSTGASSDNGRIVYQQYADHVTITWDSVGTCCTSGTDLMDYQVQLWNSGKIKYQYRQIQKLSGTSTNGASPTIGIQQSNSTGAQDYLTYYCNTTVLDTAYTNHLDGRAVWFYPPIVAPTGRCCYYNGTEQCAVNTLAQCGVLGGSWSVGLTCATPCPTARCCYNNGANCGDFTVEHCNALAGTWTTGFTCAANPCPITLAGGETCAQAVTVTPGQSWVGSTLDNAADPTVPTTCGSGYNTAAPAEWFKVVGNGNTLTLSLCDALTTYDTEIFVFCGTCTVLNCVGGDDDFCVTPGLASELSWCSALGQEYYLMITGFSGSGDYAAVLLNGAACANPLPCTTVTGRCCYNNGSQCVNNLASDCAALGGTWDEGLTCEANPCVNLCELDCHPFDILEVAEFDTCNNDTFDANGGCNNANGVPLFQQIACGDTVCGRSFTYNNCGGLNYRDTDWYEFTLTQTSDVSWSVIAEFSGVLGFIISSPCPGGILSQAGPAVSCGELVTATSTCLQAGTYYAWVGPTVFGAGALPFSGNYQYRAWLTCSAPTCPTGRCCYDGGLSCADNFLEDCNALGGVWDLGLTCASNPCPIQPANDDCINAEEIVVVPNGTASATTTLEGATNSCTDACDYTSSGPDQFYYFTLNECRLIAIMGDPNDPHISVYGDGDCCGTAILCNDDWGNNADLDLLAWLPPTTRPTATFGSMVADSLPAGTYYVRAGNFGTGWSGDYTLSIMDFGPCVIAPCDPITDLTIKVETVGSVADHIRLGWTAPQADDYKVWSTLNPANDGNPNDGADADWTLEATLLGLLAGPNTWDAPAGFIPGAPVVGPKIYVVTAVCEPFQAPTGRCCYGVDNCADITQAACADLSGSWNQFVTCASTPCPPPAPANDDCGSAIEVLNGVPMAGTNVSAHGTDISTCAFSDSLDVWYYYVNSSTNPITVQLCEATYYMDTTLDLFDGCGGAELLCNDDGCATNSLQSTMTYTPAGPGTIYIRVAGYNGASNLFTLSVTQ